MGHGVEYNMLERLSNKRVLLGVTGSIAAYKAGEVVRRLREYGAEVRVIMTSAATDFVTPMTFQALSGNPVHQHLLDTQAEAAMGHIELARWADAILVAPASADFLARLRLGRADDLLMAVCLASDIPLAVAPAMNHRMWSDQATEDNIRVLRSRGVLTFGPDSGDQACGDVGVGRMQDPQTLVGNLAEVFESGALAGLHVLVTAGPTREAIDPVRFLSNHSSGKMGFAVAQAAVEAGARVTLVSGPVSLDTPDGVKRHDVDSAQQMQDAVTSSMNDVDILIATAAVADYRPVQVQPQKIKKQQTEIQINLIKNPDILSNAKQRYPACFCVGFAAETENLEHYARTKLHDKGVDMIAANWVGETANGGFNSDENALRLVWHEGEQELPLMNKSKLARALIGHIAQRFYVRHKSALTGDNILRFDKKENSDA
ncbi:Phosphopantothenoylcysteine decarboxylase / Phosphopantothenoylcysteine synthetase [hydrothermal vent metagenome]|uniref:Phosphopantothenoylcysteine decarboxylase / Phosphopantothenoylcysteine synthetase n=1 Tax=hydrothermal vent metagenome TaxID=652676 RepID=A0A3B1ARR1_9ZZZZ